MDPGSEVSLTVLRDGQERQVTATLGELPADQAEAQETDAARERGSYGMAIEPLTADLASQLGLGVTRGVLVAEVDPNGPAAEGGVQEGDVILQVNRRDVASVADVKSALLSAPSDKPMLLLVNRRGSNVFLTLSRPAS